MDLDVVHCCDLKMCKLIQGEVMFADVIYIAYPSNDHKGISCYESAATMSDQTLILCEFWICTVCIQWHFPEISIDNCND